LIEAMRACSGVAAVDKIRDCLGLNEIALAVEKCAQRELARSASRAPAAIAAFEIGLQKHGLPCP
jgi:hypothetical protein